MKIISSRIQWFVRLVLMGCVSFSGALAASSEEQPNIILIVSDDQGSIDLNCYGALDLYTPNLDQLAKEGVKFTQFYAASPVCSTSRGALQTGRYPRHNGITGNGGSLNPDETTLAEMLKPLGYSTAIFGKWHMGMNNGGPNGEGYDEFFGHRGGCIEKYKHNTLNWDTGEVIGHDLWRDYTSVVENDIHFGSLIVRESNRFLRANVDHPFFMYVAFNNPHYPVQPLPHCLERYAGLTEPRRSYAAFISTLDEQIGEILSTVDELGLRKKTVIVFVADQGHSVETRNNLFLENPNPDKAGGGSAGPYRGHKFTLWEGGIRVPCIMSWPGTIPENVERNQAVTTMDLFPTFATYAGGGHSSKKLEGKSIQEVILSDDAVSPHKEMFWEWHGGWAVRQGDWKLVMPGSDFAGEYGLYNLAQDPGEQNDLSETFPELKTELRADWDKWNAFPDVVPPENVAVTAGDSEVTLTWDAQPEASSFVISRKDGWNSSFSRIASVTDNVYTNTGLINGKGYYYTITSLYDNAPDPDVESLPSAQVGISPRKVSNSSVLTGFVSGEGANIGSSVDLTWSNLTGIVTLGFSGGSTPLIDSVQDAMTQTNGVSGVIKMNALAVDDLSSNFAPSTWNGGGQGVGNSISAAPVGWGVRRDGKINGALQDPGEALILTFDLSALTLGPKQSVALKGITFWGDTDDSRNGDIWMRDRTVPIGTAGAGVQLAGNIIEYTDSRTISDGDQIALTRGSKDTRLIALELDIIAGVGAFDKWMEGFGLYGDSDRDPYGDLDGDSFASLYEYGVNGDPLDPDNKGVAPKMTGVVSDGGTNYIEYVYVARYSPSGIVSVHPVTTTNLLFADWTNVNHEVVSSTPIDSEYATVTNRINTLDPVKMIRLNVKEL